MDVSQVLFKTNRLNIMEISDIQLRDFSDANDNIDDLNDFFGKIQNDIVQAIRNNMLDATAYLGYIHKMIVTNDIMRFGAWDDKNTLVSIVTFKLWSTKEPEIQIAVEKGSLKHGYGTEFLQGLLTWISQTKEVDHIAYRVRIGNTAGEELIHTVGGVLQPDRNAVEALLIKTYFLFPSGNAVR